MPALRQEETLGSGRQADLQANGVAGRRHAKPAWLPSKKTQQLADQGDPRICCCVELAVG